MSIQGSVNQLLNIGAVATKYATKAASEKYAAERGAELDKSYQANLAAAKSGYTKSGAVSHSKAAEEARIAAQAATPGAGSKAYWNKGVEAQLKGEYDKKMGNLNKTVEEGVKGLKEAKEKGKQATYNQFGEYKELAPQIINNLSADDRWRVKAEQRIIQRNAFDDFMKSLDKEGK